MMKMDFCIQTATLCMVIIAAHGAKILLIPADHIGHVNFFGLAARSLQAQGHDAYVMTTHRHENLLNSFGVKHILLEFDSPMGNFSTISNLVFNTDSNIISRTMGFGIKMVNAHIEMCEKMITNKAWMKRLEDEKFDLTIVDGLDVYRCAYVFPYILEIPYITLTARHDPWNAGIPAMPFVEGFLGLDELTEQSTLLDRLKSFLILTFTYFIMPSSQYKDYQITEWAPYRPPTTYQQLFKNSEVFLINSDLLCLDTPRISAPHYHFIGATGAHPVEPLPNDFQQIIDNAQNGFVLVSFGSAIKKVPLETIERFLSGYQQSKYTFIMRYDGPMPVDIPPNVFLKKWLPQNDLLGNKKIKLFITHGGNNGQLETVYHGVPVVTIPFAGDQHSNAKRFERRGYGLVLDVWTFTAEELLTTINEVIDNPTYAQTIKTCSSIQKEFPSATQQIEFWVNFVLKYGGSHLKPPYINLPLYKVFGFDVLGVLLVAIVVFTYLVLLLCRMCCRRCCGKKTNNKKKNE